MVPGKIVSISSDSATVDYGTEKRTGKIVDGTYKVGEYVLIQGGIVIDKIPEGEAKESLRLYREACS
jgi:hydrogenase maturation factor